MALVNQGVMTSFHHVNFFLMTIQGDELEIHSNSKSLQLSLKFFDFDELKIIFTQIYSGSAKMLLIEKQPNLLCKLLKFKSIFELPDNKCTKNDFFSSTQINF